MNCLPIYEQYIEPVPYEEKSEEIVNTDSEKSSKNTQDIFSIFWVVLVLLVGIAITVIGILTYAKKRREDEREEKALDCNLFRVRISQDNEVEIGAAEQMFANFYSIGKKMSFWKRLFHVNYSLSFEIVSLPEGIDFYIYCPKKFAKLIEDQILGTYQMAEIEPVSEYNIFSENKFVSVAELVLTDNIYSPIKTYEDFKADPLSNILSSLTKVAPGDGIALRMTFTPADSKWQKNGRKYVNHVNNNNSDPEKTKISVSQEKLQAIEKKCGKNGFYTSIKVVASSSSKEVAEARVNGVASSFDQFANPGINSFKKIVPKGSAERTFMYDFIYRKSPNSKKTLLNVSEIATIMHLPNKNIQIPLLNWLSYKKAPPDPRILSEGSIILGNSIYRGVTKKIAMSQKDRRRHMYVVGKTGVGKSYFLQNMIMQDIYNGEGVAFLDPHGDSVEWILDRIPPDRAEDVIYFNPADRDRPVGFNIMEYYSESDKHLVINAFIGLMYKMFDPNNQGIVGPIFERAVRNSMLTAMTEEGSTLVEVVRILTDENWVKSYWLPRIKDDLVKRYWTDQMAQTDKFHKSEALGYLVSKFDRFVTDELMRNIIGQSKSGFDFRQVMDQRKILLINLSKGLLGDESSQFLGLLLIPRILRAAMSRANIPEDQRTDFYLYVDEFQNFATDSFAQILSEARKYKLNLIVANQYIAQMDEKVRDAIFGNIGSVVSFKVGPDDSEYLQKMFEPVFTASDLMGIEAINAYARLLVDNEWPPAFSMSTWYDVKTKWKENKEASGLIRQLSRIRYGRDVNDVREEISQRAQLAITDAPVSINNNVPGFPAF